MVNKARAHVIGKAICDALDIDADRTICLRIILKGNDKWAIAEQIVVTRVPIDGEKEEKLASILKAYKLVPIEEEGEEGAERDG